MTRVPAKRQLRDYLLLRPAQVEAALTEVEQRGFVEPVPNLWQVTLGVARMLHRLAFRSNSIGTSVDPIRSTLRARVLSPRPCRLPFLLWERAVAPLDLSGLSSPKNRIVQHLLFAHHDDAQFVYDLELLQLFDGGLSELLVRARSIEDDSDPRSEWAKDLVVFEGYHSRLVSALEEIGNVAALENGLNEDCEGTPEYSRLTSRDPDISFFAYLKWCARQPATPAATLRAVMRGLYHPATGYRDGTGEAGRQGSNHNLSGSS